MVRNPAQAEPLERLGVEVVFADLQKPETLPAAVQGVTNLYHVASLFRAAGLPETVFHDINAEGTRRLLDSAIAAGVKRFVHCSTGGVLGHIKNPPADENAPYNPGDAYQRSKLEGEKIAMEYFRSGKIRGVVIRPAMVYGPGDTRNLKMFRMIARGKFFYVGDGKTKVHFVDVRDLARGFILAMEHDELNAEIYHVPGAEVGDAERDGGNDRARTRRAATVDTPPRQAHAVARVGMRGDLCPAGDRPTDLPTPGGFLHQASRIQRCQGGARPRLSARPILGR